MEIKIEDHTKEAIDAKDLAIQIALEIIGGKMERYAKTRCPVDTGLLRNSITYVTAAHPGETMKFGEADAEGGKTFASKDGRRKSSGVAEAITTDEKNVVIVGTNVRYAPYVELGSMKRKPKPFIVPSVTDHIPEYQRIIAEELKKALG